MRDNQKQVSELSETKENQCHWCREKLQGLLLEFTHCPKCNERRLIEGIDQVFDPCPVCTNLKSKKMDFLNPIKGKTGGFP